MPVHPLDKSLASVNTRLKAARIGLKIERRGEKLSLRGTLPPRPDSARLRDTQQRVPLSLPANKAGLKKIEETAKVIAVQLIQNTFDWRDYIGFTAGLKKAGADLSAQIEGFQIHFFKIRENSPKPASVRTTWSKAYAPYLRKLRGQATKHPNYLLPEIIYATIQSTQANSRSRQVCCIALDAFATFLNIALPTPLKLLWGNYGNSKTQVRTLPTDEEILSAYKLIPNAAWRFVYGIMATYGLRNHEVFFCDYSMLASGDEEAAIEVLSSTKTGQRHVWPFHPEWIDAFNLRKVILPNLNIDLTQTTLALVGQQASLQFRRYGIPFSPYDLRHAWAIRTVHIGLPDTISAQMMGHSVAVHNRTYQRWISRRDQSAAVKVARQFKAAQLQA